MLPSPSVEQQWVPLSARDGADTGYGALHDGVPPWLRASLWAWVDARIYVASPTGSSLSAQLLQEIERACRLEFDWQQDQYSARSSLRSLLETDPEKFLDALDFLVYRADAYGQGAYALQALDGILEQGGSEWRVATRDGESRLEQRVEDSVGIAMDEVIARTGRAGQYLALAWKELYGRNPNPSGAYRESVKAV